MAGGRFPSTHPARKFTRRRLQADFRAAGLELVRWYTDDQDRFALSLAAPADVAQ